MQTNYSKIKKTTKIFECVEYILLKTHIFYKLQIFICAITNINLYKYVNYKYLFKNVQCIFNIFQR